MRYQCFTTYDGKTSRFAIANAVSYEEETYHDGHNRISRATGSQWEHEALYRTAGGDWVLHHWSQWKGSKSTWQEVDIAGAVEWLLRSENHVALDSLAAKDASVAEVLAERQAQRGPRGKSAAARAEDRITLRVTTAQKERIEQLAKSESKTLTEFILGRVL